MKKPSQKERFIREIERRIISGELKRGDMLPPERELVSELNMSRTVVHTGLAQLSALGFITTRPRKGYVVTDYRTEGSMAVFESIMHYNGGQIAPDLLDGLMQSRRLIEIETAMLAAVNRTAGDISRLESIVREEDEAGAALRPELDFSFHHRVAVASGNPIYPLILKSFEPIQKRLIETFYMEIPDPAEIVRNHKKLINAIKSGDTEKSAAIMTEILEHGEIVLRKAVK